MDAHHEHDVEWISFPIKKGSIETLLEGLFNVHRYTYAIDALPKIKESIAPFFQEVYQIIYSEEVRGKVFEYKTRIWQHLHELRIIKERDAGLKYRRVSTDSLEEFEETAFGRELTLFLRLTAVAKLYHGKLNFLQPELLIRMVFGMYYIDTIVFVQRLERLDHQFLPAFGITKLTEAQVAKSEKVMIKDFFIVRVTQMVSAHFPDMSHHIHSN